MSPHALLGIKRGASLQEVKQAYARLLKLNRPDDDPVAFQQLQQAFEACVDLARRRQARVRELELAPAGEVEDGVEVAEAADVADTAEVADAANAADAVSAAGPGMGPVAFTPPEPAPAAPPRPDPGAALLGEMLRVAAGRDAARLEAWLNAQEALYSLAYKREFSERALAHLASNPAGLPWQVLEVLYQFFDVSSVADPRLRRRAGWRELWQGVRADAEFERRVEQLRQANPTYVDKLMLAELLGPPSPGRRLALLLAPMLSGRIRRLAEALWQADPVRAETLIGVDNFHYWMTLTDPARLDRRRVVSAMAQLVLLTGVFVAVFWSMAGIDAAEQVRVWGGLCVAGAILWWSWTLLRWGRHRYFHWREARFGPFAARAGAPLVADPVSAMAGFIALLSLLLCLGVGLLDLPRGLASAGGIGVVFAWTLLGNRDERAARWEAFACMASLSWLAWAVATRLWVGFADAEFVVRIVSSTAAGALGGVLLDHWTARLRRLPVAQLRDGTSYSHIAITLLAFGAILWTSLG